MALPTELYDVLEERLGISIRHAVGVSGGMVSRAAKVVTESGPIFVKWKPDAAPPICPEVSRPSVGDIPPFATRVPGMFEAEADGLSRLAATGALRVPSVIGYCDRVSDSDPTIPFLALEWIESHAPDNPRIFTRNFAAGLARLHQSTASPNGRFGLEHDNYLGRRRQSNTWTPDWPSFYRDYRIAPMIELARSNERLSAGRERRLEQLAANIVEWLTHDEQPCLIHGDLWSGNYLKVGDQAAVLDPAVYYGHREVEIAYIQLFGGFPTGFVDAYASEYPLDAGYADRCPLLQLYPLLVHLISFGEDYGPSVDAVCKRYLG